MSDQHSQNFRTGEDSTPSSALSNESSKYYSMPETVAFHGMPYGVDWEYSRGEANHYLPVSEAWGRAHQYNPSAFPRTELKQMWSSFANSSTSNRKSERLWVHSSGSEGSAAWYFDRMTLDENLRKTDPRNGVFVGNLTEVGPVQTETDPIEGPATIQVTTASSLTKSWSSTSGWSAGGQAGISVGEGSKASLTGTFSYSRTTTESTDYAKSKQKTVSLSPASGEARWLVGRRAGGYYAGWFLYRYSCAGWANDQEGKTWEAFPVRRVFVKTPDHDFAATWHQRVINVDRLDYPTRKLYESYKNSPSATPEEESARLELFREVAPHVKEGPVSELSAE